jgi:hypothetical protein
MGHVAATDACPARKIPSIALFYQPSKDFVGNDSVQVEFTPGDAKIPLVSFSIMVQEAFVVHLIVDGSGDYDATGLGEFLQPRCDVDPVAKDVGTVHHYIS